MRFPKGLGKGLGGLLGGGSPKPTPKPTPKPKPEFTPRPRPDGSRPGGKPGGKPEFTPRPRPDGSRPGGKPGGKPEFTPRPRPDGSRPGGKPGGKNQFDAPLETLDNVGQKLSNSANQIAELRSRIQTGVQNAFGPLGGPSFGSRLDEQLGRAQQTLDSVSSGIQKASTGLRNTAKTYRDIEQNITDLFNKPDFSPRPKLDLPSGSSLKPSSGHGPSTSRAGNSGLDDGTPYAPYQPPIADHDWAPIPPAAHNHVQLGDIRPNGQSFSGGHMLTGDVGTRPAATTPYLKPNGQQWHHGAGVTGSQTMGPYPPPLPNGVYTLPRPTMTGPNAGQTSVKPNNHHTMYPAGVHPGLTQNLGNQAWNGSQPNGGFTPAAHGSSWTGQAQMPFTPVWNPANRPELPPHGSGAGNPPFAGQTINHSGFANPGPGGNMVPATYFPVPDQAPPIPPARPLPPPLPDPYFP